MSKNTQRIQRCDYCDRTAKLVIQNPQTLYGQRWIYRGYLCQWHLGAHNRWAKKMGPNFKQLREVEYRPDTDLMPNA